MRRLLQLTAIFILMISVNLLSQTTVPPGDGTLTSAITNAKDGDILLLIPGRTYTESKVFDFGTIHKAITIESSDPTAADKPLVTETANDGSSTPNFFFIGDSGSITLKGIEFDGSQGGAATATHLIQVVPGTTVDSGFVHMIKVVDCLVHDLKKGVIDASNSDVQGLMIVDSVIVDSSIFHNTGTSIYMKYAGCDYVQETNSTFYNIDSYGLRVSGPGESTMPNHTAAGFVDHTTWYNIGITDPREVILLEKGPNQHPWTVKNTIISNQTSDAKTVINIKDLVDTSMQHDSSICLWMTGPHKWNKGIVADTIITDPKFADPANGDFTLPKGSQLLTYGTDGGAIGDLRWATNAPTDAVASNPAVKPATFDLAQNYPNPFNPSTRIKFSVKKSGLTSLVVYNILGKEVATLVKGNLSAGEHSVEFNAVNLPSGVYIYRLNSASQTISKKMILIK